MLARTDQSVLYCSFSFIEYDVMLLVAICGWKSQPHGSEKIANYLAHYYSWCLVLNVSRNCSCIFCVFCSGNRWQLCSMYQWRMFLNKLGVSSCYACNFWKHDVLVKPHILWWDLCWICWCRSKWYIKSNNSFPVLEMNAYGLMTLWIVVVLLIFSFVL